MTYLIDTNILIQAKNFHYGFDFCPAFWDWLIVMNNKGRLFSIDKVATEIDKGEDELKGWISDKKADLFLATDEKVLLKFPDINEWVEQRGYIDSAKSTFYSSADYFLIGHALANDFMLVTHEKKSDTTKRVKIPDVCDGLGIQIISPYAMLRQESAEFKL